MFCGNCGTQIPDGATFCPNCGSVMDQGAAGNYAGPETGAGMQNVVGPEAGAAGAQNVVGPEKGVGTQNTVDPGNKAKGFSLGGLMANPTIKKFFPFIIGGVALLIVIIVVLAIVFGSGRSYKKVVETYMNGTYYSGNVYYSEKQCREVWNLYPREVKEYVLEMMDDYYDIDSEKELLKYMAEESEDYIDDAKDYYEDLYGKKYKTSYKVVEVESLSKKELKSLNRELKSMDIDITAKEGKRITVEVTVESKNGDDFSTNEITINVIKIGRSWYLFDL